MEQINDIPIRHPIRLMFQEWLLDLCRGNTHLDYDTYLKLYDKEGDTYDYDGTEEQGQSED